MTPFYFHRLALAILSLLLDPVGCLFNKQMENVTTSQLLESMALARVISNITTVLCEQMELQVRFIYDNNFEDTASSLWQFPSTHRGYSVSTIDNAEKNLGSILSSIGGRAVVVVLGSPEYISNIFLTVKHRRLKSTNVFWLLVSRTLKDEDGVWLRSKLKGIILEGTRILLLDRFSKGMFNAAFSDVTLEGVTYLKDYGIIDMRAITESRRQVNELSGLLLKDNKVLYSNMEGRVLTVTAATARPFGILGPADEDGRVISYSGFEFALLKALSEKLNFTYIVVKSIDNSWGSLLENGTATGMVGMVYRREVNLALSHVTIVSNRAKAVDYTVPFVLDNMAIFSRAPAIKTSAFIAFSPFTPMVWLCIILATLSIGFILKLMSMVSEIGLKQVSLGSLQMINFNIFRSTVIQGFLLQTAFWSHRSIIYSWYIFCLIVSALYSGTLVAILAIPSYEKPIDSLGDLPRAVSEGFIVGTRRQTSMESLFRNAKEGIYRETWKLFHHNDLSKSLISGSKGWELATNTKFAYISVKGVMEAEEIRRGKNKHHISRETFFNMWVGLACNKGAPYIEKFDQLILPIVEGGLIEKWKQDEFRKLKKAKVSDVGSRHRAIKLIHIQAAFYVLLLGSSIATAVFGMEIIHSWKS